MLVNRTAPRPSTTQTNIVEVGSIKIKRLPPDVTGRFCIIEIGAGNVLVGVYKNLRNAKDMLSRRYVNVPDRDVRKPQIGQFVDKKHVALDTITP